MAFKLDQIVPWGRLFDEYVRMFGLQLAIEPVDYEFQRGGNTMLRIWRAVA